MADTALQFVGLQGETLVKHPGDINGESFSVRDLSDCSVFLLDYTSEVEVTNCNNCQVFIGPVDGPAIFDGCSNCKVAVACQQFQAKGCERCNFGIYCATGPTLSGCTAIKISSWAGAYPGLTAHFAAANLDPTKNQWNRVYDASALLDAPANFELVEGPSTPWEVPLEHGTSENPVPAGETTGPAAVILDASAGFSFDDAFPVENGNGVALGNAASNVATRIAGTATALQPLVTADARDALQQRLAAQAREEAEKKKAAQQAASAYLQKFYDERNAARDSRIAAGRDELARRGSSEVGPEGITQWERTISMIDFNAVRPGGQDLSRFKSVLFAAKERTAAL